MAIVHVATGLPVGVMTAVMGGGLTAIIALSLCTVIPPALATVGLLYCVRLLTATQRSRFLALLNVDIPRVPKSEGKTWRNRVLASVRSGDTWRQVLYHVLTPVIAVLESVVIVGLLSVGVAMSAVIGYRRLLPNPGPFGLGTSDPKRLGAVTLLGLALLLVAAPWLARGFAALDVALAIRLLGPSTSAMLSLRVQTLTDSRAGAVEAADAERRRIERDLHDGTQQRLVSLAMNLGRIRARLGDVPEPTRLAIAEAHEESKRALSEMRDFVRGLHPAVLDDRGLDAALSGIVARAPIPVRLNVELAGRRSPTIEAIAYFVVAEALTNVVKHAEASDVEVSVRGDDGRLRISVIDNGRGGASVRAGGGLQGLAQRASTADGTFLIISPPGGPTRIEVDLPCG